MNGIFLVKGVFAVEQSFFFELAHDAVFGKFDEVENLLYLLAHGNLLGNFDDCVFKTEVTGVDDAVGIGYVAEDAFAHVEVAQHYGVDTVVGGGVTTQNDVGWNILLHAATALNE